MAIKLDKSEKNVIEKIEGGVCYGKFSLIADTKDEVVAMGNECNGVTDLQNGTILTLGSTCFTATKEFGIINSSGTWNF